MTKIFIDGSAGTTGLRIRERLAERRDLELITLTEAQRKDTEARRDALNRADAAFLCLPDAAAKEAVGLIENEHTAVIDTSTAHRVDPNWTYGFAELHGLRNQIPMSKRIANPGCHASGFLALVTPLVELGILPADSLLSCFSLTGYSGGGKSMISEYEAPARDALLDAPRQYGITQKHKHLLEMQQVSGLSFAPLFSPIVAPFYAGMEVTVPLHKSQLKGGIRDIQAAYADYYTQGLVHFIADASENNFLSAGAFAGRDDMQVTVCGNEDRILLVSRFDNLGKGASGAAIQNLNLLLGVDETLGLTI